MTDPRPGWDPILFDLDGTLVDSVVGVTRSVAYALERLGLPEEDEATLLRHVGPPLEEGFQQVSGMTPEQADRATLLFRERYVPVGIYEARVFDGIPQLLGRLVDDGRPLAVATSKEHTAAMKVLDHYGLAGFFTAAVGSSVDTTRRGKAAVVREALRQLREAGHQGTRPVLVGDRVHDVEGAAQNGLPCIGVAWGYGSAAELDDALTVVPSPEALYAALTGGLETDAQSDRAAR